MTSDSAQDPEKLFSEGSDVIDELVNGFQRESEKASGKRKEYFEMNQQLALKSLEAHLYFLNQLDNSPESEKIDEVKDMVSSLESSEWDREERSED